MQFFWFLSLVFGVIIVMFPEFLTYLIGFFFVFLGVNILFAAAIFRRGTAPGEKTWNVGGYEIIKNRK